MKCLATLEFDGGFTFTCQLEEGHWGPHQEMGDIDGKPYGFVWGFHGEVLTPGEYAYSLSATNNSVYKD